MCMLGTACGLLRDDGLGDHGSQDSTGSELSEEIQRPHQYLVNAATFGKCRSHEIVPQIKNISHDFCSNALRNPAIILCQFDIFAKPMQRWVLVPMLYAEEYTHRFILSL